MNKTNRLIVTVVLLTTLISCYNKKPPVANFEFDIDFADINEDISFKDASKMNPTCWNWDFGDSIGKSTDKNPTYSYAKPGKYKISLSVSNEFGDSFIDSVDCIEVICLTDYDGNKYKTVKIGTQIWMAENLRTTHYSNGTAIPNVDNRHHDKKNGSNHDIWSKMPDILAWESTAYCWFYNDSSEYANKYGALYTWSAAMGVTPDMTPYTIVASSNSNPSEIQGACPTGWHLPSRTEWQELTMYLGENGYRSDGKTFNRKKQEPFQSGLFVGQAVLDTIKTLGKINEKLTNHYQYRNKSGFSANMSGCRDNSSFFDIGGFWWSSTEARDDAAFVKQIHDKSIHFSTSVNNKSFGSSIRCVKD